MDSLTSNLNNLTISSSASTSEIEDHQCNDGCNHNVNNNPRLFYPKNYSTSQHKIILESKDISIIPEWVTEYFDKNTKFAEKYHYIVPYREDYSNYKQFDDYGRCIGCVKQKAAGTYSGRNTPICNRLLHKRPDIFYTLDFIKNLDENRRDPLTLTCGVRDKLFFICKILTCLLHIHSYEMSIGNKITFERGCSFCSLSTHCCPCNSFMSIPRLKQEYEICLELNKTIVDKDGNWIDPYTVRPMAEVEFYFGCLNHKTCDQHITKCKVQLRFRNDCGFCNGSSICCICISVTTTHPHILKFFKQELNPGVDLIVTSYGSGIILLFDCPDCTYQWVQELNSRTQPGASELCPRCTSMSEFSNFELKCDEMLILYEGIKIQYQFKFPCIPKRRYDFVFVIHGKTYATESDGMQHFERVNHFHPNEGDFEERQEIDVIKTIVPLFYNISMLRLSDDDKEHIKKCFNHFITFKSKYLIIMLDDFEKYRFMFDIEDNIIKIKNFDVIVDKFVHSDYKKFVKEAYNNLFFNVVDIKTGTVYNNYVEL